MYKYDLYYPILYISALYTHFSRLSSLSTSTTMLSNQFIEHICIYLFVPFALFNYYLHRHHQSIHHWLSRDLPQPYLHYPDWLATVFWLNLNVGIIVCALSTWLVVRRSSPCFHLETPPDSDAPPTDSDSSSDPLAPVCHPVRPKPVARKRRQQRRQQQAAADRDGRQPDRIVAEAVDFGDGDLMPAQQYRDRLVLGLRSLCIVCVLNVCCLVNYGGRTWAGALVWRSSQMADWLGPSEWLSFVHMYAGIAVYVAWISRERHAAERDVRRVGGCKKWTTHMALQSARVRRHIGQEQLALVGHWVLNGLWMWYFFYVKNLYMVRIGAEFGVASGL